MDANVHNYLHFFVHLRPDLYDMLAPLLTTFLIATTPVTEVKDTISGSVVTSSVKREDIISDLHGVSSFLMRGIEERGIASPKNLSAVVPGLNIPDYGTAMTSTIYVRGLGSRMDNPVIGLYVDDVPVLDKNCYDFSFADIRSLEFQRGPQGTLYGRNSMLGVLSVETLSPSVYQGAKASIEYGSAATVSAKASIYKGKLGLVAAYSHSNGFYVNEYDNSRCGLSDATSLRAVYAGKAGRATFDNILTLSYTDQTGYPYRLWLPDERRLLPIDYNDKSGYQRLSVMDGLRLKADLLGWKLSSVTSVQMLFDSMNMDQDFTPKSIFTLNQTQKQFAATQEIILRPSVRPDWWDSQTGVFLMAKFNRMSAPVDFLEGGIKSMILDNANSGIPADFGRLDILEDRFRISSDFDIMTGNLAAYHESVFSLGRWRLTAGLRLDYDGGRMCYESNSDIHFILAPAMPDYIPFNTFLEGNESVDCLQLQPKISVIYDAANRRMKAKGTGLKFSATVSKGYRGGGFNTQIFSDVLQRKMMLGMMESLGVHLDGHGDLSTDGLTYKPEICIDYEFGGKFRMRSSGHILESSVTAYRIDCRNQQMTVFPYEEGTGRMMTNAGKSRSFGAEIETFWSWKGFSLTLSGTLMDARFIEYDDGRYDWSGNRIPYSPDGTLYLRAGYKFAVGGHFLRSVSLNADLNHYGRTNWNESGDVWQPPYSLIGADIRLSAPKVELWLRGLNLSGTEYSVFYFKSVGNSFFQMGKPRRFTIGMSIKI